MLCKAHYLAFEKPYFCEVKGWFLQHKNHLFALQKVPFYF